jgi:hypothetical protein
MSNQPSDLKLYEKIAKLIKKKYPKNSAYRSGLLVKKYKEEFLKKHGKKKKPYTGKKPTKEGISRWFKENWTNQKGKTGYQKKSDVYRPNKRVTSKTPATFKELTKKEIKNAQKEKKSKGRVSRFKKD